VRVTDLQVRLYRIPPPLRIQDAIQRVALRRYEVTGKPTDVVPTRG
jgi:hypothetical protein